MRPVLSTTALVTTGVLATAFTSACRDHDTPVGPVARSTPALSSQSLESLGELPPFIEIAREVPTFGGFWFNEQDQIVVGLTDLADFPRVVTMIPRYLGAHQPSGYVAMKVERSFVDLARFRATLRDPVFRQARVVSLGVKESANRVAVGVTDPGVESTVRGLARTLGIPDEALAVAHVPEPRAASHTLQDPHPGGAIEGGWEISDTVVHLCTLGFPAIRPSDGSYVFVTNSHCTPTVHGFDGGRIRQDAGGATIGWEILDPPAWSCGGTPCRNADAALISAVAPVQFARLARPTERVGNDRAGGAIIIDHTNPTFTISGRLNFVWENEILDKVGRTTGWTYGAVEDTCTDFSSGREGEPKWKKLCSDRVDFAINDGDSGSPVFYWKPDGTAELRGIVFA